MGNMSIQMENRPDLGDFYFNSENMSQKMISLRMKSFLRASDWEFQGDDSVWFYFLNFVNTL